MGRKKSKQTGVTSNPQIEDDIMDIYFGIKLIQYNKKDTKYPIVVVMEEIKFLFLKTFLLL